MLVLFGDTDCEVTPSRAARYGARLISMPYTVGDETFYPYESYTEQEFDSQAFYDMLRGGTLPTTSALSEAKYVEYFEPEFAAGNDILYVHLSEAMSGTFVPMRAALKELQAKYPERKFYEIDAKGISILGYTIFCEVGDMLKAGKSVEEILDWAKREVDHFACYFFADDLKFFRRSGRVSGLAATMGGLIGLRPLINMNAEGKMVSIGTVKGRIQAVEKVVSYLETLGDDIRSHRIIIASCGSQDLAKLVDETLRAKLGNDLVTEVIEVNPTAGSHCGPNATGVCFHAKNR